MTNTITPKTKTVAWLLWAAQYNINYHDANDERGMSSEAAARLAGPEPIKFVMESLEYQIISEEADRIIPIVRQGLFESIFHAKVAS